MNLEQLSEDDTFRALQTPLTDDEIKYGRRKWIYCFYHKKPHPTGWCTVANSHKVSLLATNKEDAIAESIIYKLISQ